MNVPTVRLPVAVVLTLVVSTVVGCRGSPERVDADRTLPFTVRLTPVEIVEDETEREAATPADFGVVEDLTLDFAKALGESRIFSAVVTQREPHVPADLELAISIRDLDFGEGNATIGGAIVSTIAWIAVGHLSWFVDNRSYPDSRVSIAIRVYEPSEDAKVVLFEDIVPLRGLELNFMERTGAGGWLGWLLNILVPPWVGDGDPQVSGRSLAARSARFFADQETAQILYGRWWSTVFVVGRADP